ncbi:MAG: hypothetical protein ACR2RE_04550 [Geminicoccaceae bacterium]
MNDDDWAVDVVKGLTLFGAALLGIAGGALALSLIAAIIAKMLGLQ